VESEGGGWLAGSSRSLFVFLGPRRTILPQLDPPRSNTSDSVWEDAALGNATFDVFKKWNGMICGQKENASRKQSKAKQSKAKQSKAKQSKAKQSDFAAHETTNAKHSPQIFPKVAKKLLDFTIRDPQWLARRKTFKQQLTIEHACTRTHAHTHTCTHAQISPLVSLVSLVSLISLLSQINSSAFSLLFLCFTSAFPLLFL
jgi:hypothetical protein